MRWKRTVSAVAVTVLAGAATHVPASAVGRQQAARAGVGGVGEVTLVTGDVVRVRGKGSAAVVLGVRPGKGRERTTFQRLTVGGHRYVIPSDAAPLVGQGRIDRRFFDVGLLSGEGYGDSRRGDIPMIVQRGKGRMAVAGTTKTVALPALGMDALHVEKKNAGTAWASLTANGLRSSGAVARVWLDGRRQARLDKSVKQIGAPAAWKRGWDGKGSTVAVLDTGYDAGHPDLKAVVAQSRGFTGQGAKDVQDRNGHGTHVASTVAGSGAASKGRFRGVAPGARIAAGKVLDDDGSGYDSWVLAGMEWAATQVKAKVVNMSLGGRDIQGIDPLEQAVNTLTARTGTLFVVSAGNDGPGQHTLGSPGSADSALTVGAVGRNDSLAEFSAEGPRLGDYGVKPDITAPGVGIVAARAKNTQVDQPYDENYARASGTSMAAPHVAGAAAILAARHPKWPAARLKAALMNAAKPTKGASAYRQGAGRLDVARAVGQSVVSTEGTLLEIQRYPHAKTTHRTITYENSGAKPVRLALRVDAPKKVFRLDGSTVTVPAKGRAAVRIAIGGPGAPQGAHSGTVVATSGTTVVRTVIGAFLEPKAHNVTFKAIDHDGKDAGELLVLHDQNSLFNEFVFTDGTTKYRFPAGRYNLFGTIATATKPDGCSDSTLAHTPVALTKDRSVVVDSRAAKKSVSVSIDDPSVEMQEVYDFGFGYVNGAVQYEWNPETNCPPSHRYVLPVKQRGLAYYVHTSWRKKGATPDVPGPYRYEVYDYRRGEFPKDPSYKARVADMTTVQATVRGLGAPSRSDLYVGAAFPEITSPWITGDRVNAPGTTTLRLTRNPLFRWHSILEQEGMFVNYAPLTFAGAAHRVTFGSAVVGPALKEPLPVGFEPEQRAIRTGDVIHYSPGGFFSESGHGAFGDGPAQGSLVLRSGGKVIKKASFESYDLTAAVPAGAAEYELTADAKRSESGAKLSTKVTAVWRFRSGRTKGVKPLPLRVVHFAPQGLDNLNRAAAGRPTVVSLWAESNDGSATKGMTVEASFDRGRTWRRVPVKRAGDRWTMTVAGAPAGTVSLRAVATGPAGSSVTQTVLDAYAVGARS
ncbi:S8 family serine peptidase [Actinomadura sp. 6N118]|uniref:S8 family serine peptidase n=1 Tax=Actinomadura sp. 6N118 TaxID=3375151 RepID=UPI0037B765B7